METALKHKILLPILILILAGCESRSDKDVDLDTSGDVVNTGDIISTDLGLISSPSSISESSDPTIDVVPTPRFIAPLPTSVFDELSDAPSNNRADQENIGAFASLDDNTATGKLAPDFTARMMGDWTFSLSAQRGSFVLLYPTVVGCADCVFTMNQIAQAYPEFEDMDLKVVMLNLFPADVPESWLAYVDLYPDLSFLWGVVDGLDFAFAYELYSLGSVILIDPQGRSVFQNQFPLTADQFRRLFALVDEAQKIG